MEFANRESPDSNEDVEPCGASCFSYCVCQTKMLKGFKLPSDTPKYDGIHEPKTCIDDYLTAVRCHGGSRTTAMQCLQLQL